MTLLKEEIRVRCLLRTVPRAYLHHTVHHHTQPGAVQLCKLRAELINWHVCTASLIQMIIFQWGITLLCKKSPASSELIQWSLQNPVFHCMSWDRQGVRQHCLATPIAFYRASLTPLMFVTHTLCGRAKNPKLLQYIFLVFQDLMLSKWSLLWSTVLVILIQEWPRRLLRMLFPEDKVNAKIFACVEMIVASLEDGKWYISMFSL